jgi:glycosyltransferase involved in cell wall biosynthesis
MTLSAVRLEPEKIQLPERYLRAVPTADDGDRLTVSVIIPALNEAPNLLHVLGNIPDGYEVILVDGNSTDGTVEVARSLWPDVRVVYQTGVGKGNALACGFVAASGDVVVTIDADGSMDPKEIPAFVEAVVEHPGTYAKGSRILPQAGSDDLTRVRRFGNRMLVWAVNVLYGTDYTDLCYGLNAFWRRDLDRLGFPRTETGIVAKEHQKLGFEVETYLNVRAARAGLRIVEVPSFEHRRANGVGNLRVVRDGLRILRTILVERARRYPAIRPNVRPLAGGIGAAGSAVGVRPGTKDSHRGADRIAA